MFNLKCARIAARFYRSIPLQSAENVRNDSAGHVMTRKRAWPASLLESIISKIVLNRDPLTDNNKEVRIFWVCKTLTQTGINVKGQGVNLTRIRSEGYFKTLNIKIICQLKLLTMASIFRIVKCQNSYIMYKEMHNAIWIFCLKSFLKWTINWLVLCISFH